MYFTERQLKIVNFIRGHILDKGYSPTIEEIAQAFGIAKATAHEHIRALEDKGALTRSRHRARSIELADDPRSPAEPTLVPAGPDAAPAEDAAPRIPILGSIKAGQPLEAVPDQSELNMGTWLPRGRDYFVLTVSGQSMIEDGIHDGDLVVIEKRSTARNGDVVVALVDGNEATLKRFYREKDQVRLQPANSSMDPIYRRDVLIQGVVVGLLRQF